MIFPLFLLACSDGELSSSDSPPTLTLLRPQDGGSFVPGVDTEVCAQVSDNGPTEELLVTFETDEAGVLHSGAPATCEGGNAGWTGPLPDGEQTLVVTVVDPGGQAARASATLSPEANTPPGCQFVAPADGAGILVGDSITVRAGVDDAEDGPSELYYYLSSDLDGSIAEGTPTDEGDVEVPWTPVSAETHALRLLVTDPGGATGDCTATLYVNPCLDLDGDGVDQCEDDCDDEDATTYPGAGEIPDGKDNDCDGVADEGTDLYDDDADGYAEVDGDCDDSDATTYPGAPDAWYDGKDSDCAEDDDFDRDGDGATYDTDCDDADPSTYPGAVDAWYDGVDSDCAGNDDYDRDGDGYPSDDYGGTDCDDGDAAVNPGAIDLPYDGVDSDCDGANDADADGDGYTAESAGGSDCDDTDPSINPGEVETWYDGIDSDCDGADDYDQDADGYDAAAYGGSDCDDLDDAVHPGAVDAWYDGIDSDCDAADDYDQDGDGFRAEAHGGSDCDDEDAAVYPGAPDAWYDGVDSDCAGNDDDDQDGDGLAAASTGGTDCDDEDAAVYPGAADAWYDGVDSDCDGTDDYDQDGDGYASDDYGGTDCDDLDPDISPGEVETWYDGVDSDCDGADDYDKDGDGYRHTDFGGTDCDDTDPDISPGAGEIRNAADDDCDGSCDEGLLSPGDVIITEIMKDPSAVSDEDGEWLELYNASGADIRVCNWTLYDLDVDSWTTDEEVEFPAGSLLVLGRSARTATNGGVSVAIAYGSSFLLANGADEVVVTDGSVVLDGVSYDDGVTFPDRAGRSLTLDPGAFNALDNDDGANWCEATSSFGSGDLGTPGAANDEC